MTCISTSAGFSAEYLAAGKIFGQFVFSWSRPCWVAKTLPSGAMAIPIPLRIPVAKRSFVENTWPGVFASYFQMPARVSSSVRGSTPGDSLSRSFCWQLFVFEPTLRYSAPSPPMAKLRARCPPQRHAAHDDFTFTFGCERRIATCIANDLRTFVDVEEAVGERDPRVAERTDALDHIGAAVVVGVAQRDERRLRRGRGTGRLLLGRRPGPLDRDVDVAVRSDGRVPAALDAIGEDRGAESCGQRELRRAGRARRGLGGSRRSDGVGTRLAAEQAASRSAAAKPRVTRVVVERSSTVSSCWG